MHIVLVKQTDDRLTDAEGAVVRKFLFGHLSGATEADTKAWYRFCRALNESGSGEYFGIKIERKRSGPFHRLHMKVISGVFKAQGRLADFKQFRLWLAIGAGFVDWMAGPKGGVVPVPRSINFEQCSEEDIRQFHDDALAFLRTEHAAKYLFPDVAPALAEAGIEEILGQFERNT